MFFFYFDIFSVTYRMVLLSIFWPNLHKNIFKFNFIRNSACILPRCLWTFKYFYRLFYTFFDKKKLLFSFLCFVFSFIFIYFLPFNHLTKSILFYVNGLVPCDWYEGEKNTKPIFLFLFLLTLHNRLYNILDVP